MKIELFQQFHNEGYYQLEQKVNNFLASDIEVCDIKMTTTTMGGCEYTETVTTIMVIYK
ncbi:TPA: hypothetical protein VBA44_001320 [Streptococcus agalactiae]|nr:hypothetical protein [Streptococcus agalactiae]HEO6606316.1 hypothetical protein [Streptococcus agalactiae]HEO6632000.1 hypothetical protein [Streptococcus agalactiae]